MNLKIFINLITFSRLFLTFVIIYFLFEAKETHALYASILFALASFTDFLDGWLARRFNAVTKLGSFFDPIVDKVLVNAILIMLLFRDVVNPITVIIFICRDILVNGLRMVAATENNILSARGHGKLKTVIQMVSLYLILVGMYLQDKPPLAGYPFLSSLNVMLTGRALLWLAIMLSLYSAWQYFQAYLEEGEK